jgi:hypothetical protein
MSVVVVPEECVVEESVVTPPPVTRTMVRTEAKLVRRYRKWLDPTGVRLRGLVVETGDGKLRADLFDVRCHLLIEAKAGASRENIRYAIGQLLDYQRYVDPSPDLAVLLPSPPTKDLIRRHLVFADRHLVLADSNVEPPPGSTCLPSPSTERRRLTFIQAG